MSKSKSRKHGPSPSSPGTSPKRGGLLTFAILLIIVSNVILAIAIHSLKGTLSPDAPIVLIGLTWLSAVVSVVGGVLMWFWKKWGLYLYIVATIAITVLAFVIFATAGAAMWGMIMGGLLPMILVLYIVKPYTNQFQ